jgi:hypothetical protein
MALKVHAAVFSTEVPCNHSRHFQFLEEPAASIFMLQVNRFGMWAGRRRRRFVCQCLEWRRKVRKNLVGPWETGKKLISF